MSELTDATNFEVERATHESELNINGPSEIDGMEANRWQKKGDRLYINGPAKWEKNGTYVDLEAEQLVDLPGSRDVTVEIDDETLTLTVHDEGGIGAEKTNTIILSFETPEDDDSEDDEDEQKIVADGGEDVTEHVDDETIESAIEDHDGPLDHDKTATVAEVRDALAWMQQSTVEFWSEWLSNVENGEVDVVYEGDDCIVFTTGEQNVPRRDLREHYDGDLNDRTSDVVSAIHHTLARERCDYDWGYEYPLVVRKPADFDAGQEFADAVVNGLQRRGLSPGQAWAYYGVEIRGESRKRWGERKGDYDHKSVSDALEKATAKLP
jgi:hypothetical protein